MEAPFMYRSWTCSGENGESVARSLEAHLNEFAGEVVSVSYAVDETHYVLVVYRAIAGLTEAPAIAVAEAEQILDTAHH
jgi:hypothetical protein